MSHNFCVKKPLFLVMGFFIQWKHIRVHCAIVGDLHYRLFWKHIRVHCAIVGDLHYRLFWKHIRMRCAIVRELTLPTILETY